MQDYKIRNLSEIQVKLILVCLLIFLSNCKEYAKKDTIIIKGNIKNLPDGTLYIGDWRQEIDSVNTKNGKFVLEIIKGIDFEPKYIHFLHVAHGDSVRRVFMFDTKAKYKSKPMATSTIMLEENLLELSGELFDSKVKHKSFSSSFKGDREFDIQTKVYLEDTVRFPTRYTISHLNGMLDKYPYSYHVFFEFEKLAHSMNTKRALTFFERFDPEVRNSNAGKRVENYIKLRSTRKLNTTLLPDVSNQQRNILIPGKRIHLVVLWASWCGPCRKEIPDLKRIHKKFENQKLFDMVSISLDEDSADWKKALNYEKMPWRQLIMSKEVNMYSKELFSFDGSIPTTLLVDGDGKIVKKHVGYSKNNDEEIMKFLDETFQN
ncbi:TlpA disulfide reductase family protein [Arundinibacter roseus]|uniref:AhpC/TSA family protein n=1 Tax=Arundinibacter roseus TaxID=2070510 RepID=A0A4R4KB87_9BACT|nr:TlpA disulfide reductase family protein [Arundinibacter roseus]TDB65124.1 AhpC/TSA family protein [Arundinibacter roseus]